LFVFLIIAVYVYKNVTHLFDQQTLFKTENTTHIFGMNKNTPKVPVFIYIFEKSCIYTKYRQKTHQQ